MARANIPAVMMAEKHVTSAEKSQSLAQSASELLKSLPWSNFPKGVDATIIMPNVAMNPGTKCDALTDGCRCIDECMMHASMNTNHPNAISPPEMNGGILNSGSSSRSCIARARVDQKNEQTNDV